MGVRMRLGLNLGYWGAGNDSANLALAQEADRLGYDVVWVAEAYGSDAATVLSWIAAQTEHVDIGSAGLQIPPPPPALTPTTAAPPGTPPRPDAGDDRDDGRDPGHPLRRALPARHRCQRPAGQ